MKPVIKIFYSFWVNEELIWNVTPDIYTSLGKKQRKNRVSRTVQSFRCRTSQPNELPNCCMCEHKLSALSSLFSGLAEFKMGLWFWYVCVCVLSSCCKSCLKKWWSNSHMGLLCSYLSINVSYSTKP